MKVFLSVSLLKKEPRLCLGALVRLAGAGTRKFALQPLEGARNACKRVELEIDRPVRSRSLPHSPHLVLSLVGPS